MVARGWTVVAAGMADDSVPHLADHNILFEPIAFSRKGLTLQADAQALSRLHHLYRNRRPALVHLFNIKPIVLGRLAAATIRKEPPTSVATVTGLGYGFSQGTVVGRLAELGLRATLPSAAAVVFQNRDDLALGLERRWVQPDRARLIVSSGVDTIEFKPADRELPNRHLVLFVGRLLRQKGIGDFIEVAKRVRSVDPKVTFAIGGEIEREHPDAVPEAVIEEAVAGGHIRFLGYVRDMTSLLQETAVLLMPSTYREGVPRVVLEAAACAVPVVGADVPGTREAVLSGISGFLVPAGNIDNMVARVLELLRNPAQRSSFGQAGRALMTKDFDTQVVTARYLQLYEEILGKEA